MFKIKQKIIFFLNVLLSYLTIKSLNVIIKNPSIIRINLKLFGPYHINYYPNFIKNERRQINNIMIETINWSKFNLLFNFKKTENQFKSEDFFFKKSMVDKIWVNSKLNSHLDIELCNASHRFKWLLFDINSNNIETVYNENYKLIKKWFQIYNKPDKSLAWHPYNASERVCNLIVFFTHYNKIKSKDDKLDDFVNKIIHTHSFYLLDNLEYPASKIINNHILNNGRALFYISEFTENNQIKHFSKVLITKNLIKLLDNSFILKESSVHYHFLITMWISEIYLISNLSDDQNFKNFIESHVYNMLDACDYFLYVNFKKIKELPKIGDVSPDMPLNWFDHRNKKTFGWTSIWNFEALETISQKSNFNNEGWYKLVFRNWAIFSYSHPNPHEYPSGHGHDDFMSFLLYHKQTPILTDIGVFSYNQKDCNTDKSSHHHSTFTINGKTVLDSGLGYKSPLSSFSRGRVKSKLEKNNLYFSGSTLTNINWLRTIKIIDNKTVSIEDICEGNKNTLKGNFYLSKELKLLSKTKNKLIFANKKNNFSFLFDTDYKIKIRKVSEFTNYGKSCDALCVSYEAINTMNLNIKYIENLKLS